MQNVEKSFSGCIIAKTRDESLIESTREYKLCLGVPLVELSCSYQLRMDFNVVFIPESLRMTSTGTKTLRLDKMCCKEKTCPQWRAARCDWEGWQ